MRATHRADPPAPRGQMCTYTPRATRPRSHKHPRRIATTAARPAKSECKDNLCLPNQSISCERRRLSYMAHQSSYFRSLATLALLVGTVGCPSDDSPSVTGDDSSSGTGGATDGGDDGVVDDGPSLTEGSGGGDGTDTGTDSADSTGDDAETDVGPDPMCGDDVMEADEVCDADDLDGEDCVSQGFGGGTLACAADCASFDTSGCNDGPRCGDDTAEGAEACDGTDLREEDCASQGFEAGRLACADDCTEFDTSACTLANVCGDDQVGDDEVCDGTDFNGEGCATLGFDGGPVACEADCSAFDTSACTMVGGGDGDCCSANGTPGCDDPGCTAAICAADAFCCDNQWDEICADAALLEPMCEGVGGCPTGMEVCGDDTVEAGEVCDGLDLAGEDCVSQGFDDGDLGCAADCQTFDTSACGFVPGMGDCCGDNGTPGCDDATCQDTICAADAFCCQMEWDAMCGNAAMFEPDCNGVGGSCPDGSEVCGNDMTEAGEACDGADLNMEDCVSLGFGGGALSCAADCLTFDTSMCADPLGDCCMPNGTPGCDDMTCQDTVCAFDPFCCDTEWDGQCAGEAAMEADCAGVGSCPP